MRSHSRLLTTRPWRLTWIRQALATVKRGQTEIKYHKALMDAYMEHLGVLEVMLIAAAEQKRSTEEATNLRGDAGAASAEKMINLPSSDAALDRDTAERHPLKRNMRELRHLSPAAGVTRQSAFRDEVFFPALGSPVTGVGLSFGSLRR